MSLEKQFVRRARDLRMPQPQELQLRAQEYIINKYKGKLTAEYISANFDELLDELWRKEFEIYLEEEKRVNVEIMGGFFASNLATISSQGQDSVMRLFAANYYQMYDFFISLTQSRRNRAGESFQEHLRFLLSQLGYPFELQKKLDARVDYVFPSKRLFEVNRGNCIVISAKRTLRERWMETVEELSGTRAGRMYLATIDEKLTKNTVRRILTYNVTIVTLEKLRVEKFADMDGVISYKTLVIRDIPAFSTFWEGEI